MGNEELDCMAGQSFRQRRLVPLGPATPTRITRLTLRCPKKTGLIGRDLDLPERHPGSDEEIRKILAQKPKHWMEYYDGTTDVADETPDSFVPQHHDQ